MLFNSINFGIFLFIIFLLYWILNNKGIRLQNCLLLVASYFFYACWDWRFLFLLIFSTLLDYFTGIMMEKSITESMKGFWFWLSVIINVGFLAVFKYFNFFSISFSNAFSNLGVKINPWTLKVILPVGISFYTFHGLSYVIDIYKGRIKAEKNFIDYTLFVSFFPLLVAGPIERATHLLPQIKKERKFEYLKMVDGLRQILWGLFKKIVIADSCAESVNSIFNNSSHYNGSTHVVGAILFAFQIYCDFSGYSDIAIGTARLLGIELLRNFAFPYFSRDIAEFWRRWHISLSSWFKDYLYIPLGGSRVGTFKKIRNTFIIFLVSGFWHGANWTFIVWGCLHALYIMPSIIFKTNRRNIETIAMGKMLPNLKELSSMLLTFTLTVIAWVFFRSENLHAAFEFLKCIFSSSLFKYPTILPVKILFVLAILILIEWLGRENKYALEKFAMTWTKSLRWSFYIFLILIIFLNQGKQAAFIYFQF